MTSPSRLQPSPKGLNLPQSAACESHHDAPPRKTLSVKERRKLGISRFKRKWTIMNKCNDFAQLCDAQVYLVIQFNGADKKHIFHSNPDLDFPAQSWQYIRTRGYPAPVVHTPETLGPAGDEDEEELDEAGPVDLSAGTGAGHTSRPPHEAEFAAVPSGGMARVIHNPAALAPVCESHMSNSESSNASPNGIEETYVPTLATTGHSALGMPDMDEDTVERATEELDEDPFDVEHDLDTDETFHVFQPAAAQNPVASQSPQQPARISPGRELDFDTSSSDSLLDGNVSSEDGCAGPQLGSPANISRSASISEPVYDQQPHSLRTQGLLTFEKKRHQNMALNHQILNGIRKGVQPDVPAGTASHGLQAETPASQYASPAANAAGLILSSGPGVLNHVDRTERPQAADLMRTPPGSVSKITPHTSSTQARHPSVDESTIQHSYQKDTELAFETAVQKTPPDTPSPPTRKGSCVSSSSPSQDSSYGYTTCKFVLASDDDTIAARENSSVGPTSTGMKRRRGRPRKNAQPTQELERGTGRLLRKRFRRGE